MERFDTSPVYRVTSHSYIDPEEYFDSDDMSFSDDSSVHSMSTLQSNEVAGSSFKTPLPPFPGLGRLALLFVQFGKPNIDPPNSIEYFRTVHGFTYLTDESLPVFLPADNFAERFYVVLHTLLRLAYNGVNVPPVVDQLLRSGGVDRTTDGARVLDLATNSGAWVQDMAEAYPTTKFVSVDMKPLVPFVPHRSIEFEVYNFSIGLIYPDASFDFVQARFCVAMTKDFNFLLREMHRVLKPGGILMITEYPVQPYEADSPSVHLYSSPRRVAGVKMIRQSWEAQGVDLTPWEDMSTRLNPGHLHWDNHSADQPPKPGDTSNAIRGFCSIALHTRLIPSGPWLTDQTQRMIGELSRLASTSFYKALLPMLMMEGMGRDKAQEIVDGLIEELIDDRYKSYMKSKIWTARRI